ncbi:MAG: tetratricopeptide repeat protein [Rhodospirillaceae bacterium]
MNQISRNHANLGFFDPAVVEKFEGGVAIHQAGDLGGAEKIYREVLGMSSGHPGALNLLGVVHHQNGDHEAAIGYLKQAIEIAPANADFHLNLGAVYFAMEDRAEAERNFRTSVEMNPSNPEANGNLGTVLKDMDRNDEAYSCYEAAWRLAPANPRYAKRVADLALELGKFDDAADAFEAYLKLVPESAEACNNLGYVYERLGYMQKTADCYRRALELCPDSPEIANNLGSVLSRQGRAEEAQEYFDIALNAPAEKWENAAHVAGTYLNTGDFQRSLFLFEKAVEKDADNPSIWSDYGNALTAAARYDEAEQAFRKALELKPDFAEVWNNLGNNSFRAQKLDEATDQFKQAIRCRPMYLEPHINVCLTLMYQRKVDEAYLYAQAAVNLADFHPVKFTNPHKVFRGVCDFDSIDRLGNVWDMLENFTHPDVSASFLEMLPFCDTPETTRRLAELHFRWGRELINTYANEEPLPPLKPRDPEAKFRIGFVSSDLRRHSVSNFVLPIVRNYDRSKFEIHCFAPFASAGDQVQEKIRGLVDGFHVLENMADRDIALGIREQGIDVLLELNGFTRDTMIRALRFKPAPVQIYWLGYPFTTGLPQMDRILVDPYFAPENDDWLIEKPLRMPEAWVCFDSLREVAIAEKTPVERNGFITFGTLNNTYKFTRDCIAAWSVVMKEVENSQFLLVRPEADSVILQNMLRSAFAANGVDPERINFFNNFNRPESHLNYYNLIDISLDTFPMTGGTTTCDAIWMGCPVISLVGPSLHQRVSYSLLENAGCGELACFSFEEYLEKAVMLANDVESLREYRQKLRPALLNSPLCQGERFARNFETVVTGAYAEYEKSGA